MVILALMMTKINSSLTSPVIMAGFTLSIAVLVHALSRVFQSEGLENLEFVNAVIFKNTVPEVDSRLITLFGKTSGIAGNSISALIFAVVKGILTF